MASQKYSSSLIFIDLLFNVLMCITYMFMLAFMQIHPPAKTQEINVNAKIIISMTWPDGSKHDVDLWVMCPNGKPVWFKNTQNGVVFLDRDDRGEMNDWVMGPDGKAIINPKNNEMVSIRAYQPGEYIVNVQLYQASSQSPLPVPVKVQLIQVKPFFVILKTVSIDLVGPGDEKTAFHFKITNKKTITDITSEQTKFIYRHETAE